MTNHLDITWLQFISEDAGNLGILCVVQRTFVDLDRRKTKNDAAVNQEEDISTVAVAINQREVSVLFE